MCPNVPQANSGSQGFAKPGHAFVDLFTSFKECGFITTNHSPTWPVSLHLGRSESARVDEDIIGSVHLNHCRRNDGPYVARRASNKN